MSEDTPNNIEPRELIHPAYQAINWNQAPDFDNKVWKQLTTNFWLPEKISVSNDIKSWETLSEEEKTLVLHVFTGLTMLDTIQGRFGATSIMRDATSLFEEANYLNIAFMEAVHARSYSNIFSTLSTTKDINASFRWSEENEFLRKKESIIMSYYRDTETPYAAQRRKIASTLLESFLFYSGFYLPLYLNSQAKLTNASELIKLIIRDEGVHGMYIGKKYQDSIAEFDENVKEELKDFTYTLLLELFDNEIRYTQDLYDEFGLSEEVIAFLKYNANKALANLGYEPLFPDPDVKASITSQLNAGNDTFDFFSGAGANYAITEREELSEEDWDF
jgi:ribonucleoside-diphosphate reductase beta chain